MGRCHLCHGIGPQKKLCKQFNGPLKGKRIIVLGIPDEYEYMQKELVELLETKVPRYLNVSIMSQSGNKCRTQP